MLAVHQWSEPKIALNFWGAFCIATVRVCLVMGTGVLYSLPPRRGCLKGEAVGWV